MAKHCLVDYWPEIKKFNLILGLYEDDTINILEMLELYAPMVRFHDRWPSLQKDDFHHNFNGLKGESKYLAFLEGSTDVTEGLKRTNKQAELDSESYAFLDNFLSYCQAENYEILFLGTPWATSEEEKAMVNKVSNVISNYGFPVIDLTNSIDELGMNPRQDYYDFEHTNIHGALKITDYLSQYLLDHYDFLEKSGGGLNTSWDIAYEKYKEIITPYLTEEELSKLP